MSHGSCWDAYDLQEHRLGTPMFYTGAADMLYRSLCGCPNHLQEHLLHLLPAQLLAHPPTVRNSGRNSVAGRVSRRCNLASSSAGRTSVHASLTGNTSLMVERIWQQPAREGCSAAAQGGWSV